MHPLLSLICERKRFFKDHTGLIILTMTTLVPIFAMKLAEGLFTWNTLGADTKLAKAEDSVAAMIPAMISGPNADTSCMT